MLEEVHVVKVLEQAKAAIKKGDSAKIKDLSNQTIHSASIYQDADNIALAVVLYALSKLIERKRTAEHDGWCDLEKNYLQAIDRALFALKKKDIEVYRDQIANIREAIKSCSGDLKTYVEDVFRKASINKASRLYEHGLSLAKTAKILGITLWDLNHYVGETKIADVNLAYTKDLGARIKSAQRMFKK